MNPVYYVLQKRIKTKSKIKLSHSDLWVLGFTHKSGLVAETPWRFARNSLEEIYGNTEGWQYRETLRLNSIYCQNKCDRSFVISKTKINKRLLRRWFMYIRKRGGPRTDPRGTPGATLGLHAPDWHLPTSVDLKAKTQSRSEYDPICW